MGSSHPQSRDDGVMAVEVPSDRPGGLPVPQPPAFCLRFAAKLDTACFGGLPAILRPLYDPLSLILSESA